MQFYYHYGYEEKTDNFWALIDDGSKNAEAIFSIDSTDEVCEYIETGRMKHIDDIEGLQQFVTEMGFLRPDDVLTMGELMI